MDYNVWRAVMIISIDYDGTFTINDSFPDIGIANKDAVNVLLEMQEKGHDIVLNTMRYGIKLNDAVRFIESHGIKLSGINECPGQKRWTKSPKVHADVYIDDKSIGVPKNDDGSLNWNKIHDLLIDLGF